MNQPPQVLHSLDEASGLALRGPLHLAVGMFDGVHLGHRAVLDMAVQSARRCGGAAGVLTFSPHPSRLFRPEDPVRMIMSDTHKARLLVSLGVDLVISQPFNRDFSLIEAEDLLGHLTNHLPELKALYVGENWRFGRGRRGDIQMLLSEGRRHRLTIYSAPRIHEDGEPISSTRIRGCLEDGRIELANAMLGYSYFSEGIVIPGKQLGRTIGFPTLNQRWIPDLKPCYGGYAVRVRSINEHSHRGYAAVANYGLRPTVEESVEPRLEIHLLEECPFNSGDELHVEWLSFIRAERKFENLEALRSQIERDLQTAKAYFNI